MEERLLDRLRLVKLEAVAVWTRRMAKRFS
jgi:hypothetical protein